MPPKSFSKFSQKLGLLACIGLISVQAESLAPAQKAPLGQDPSKTPVLLSFGIDDNRFVEGFEWMQNELFKGRVNPAGQGNKATFDGTPVRGTFYVIGNASHGWNWRMLYDDGHEISNHTWSHEYNMSDLNADLSLDEIHKATQYLVNDAGIPISHIYGFRTPYLAHSNDATTFQALKNLGFQYDCSLDVGTQGDYAEAGHWPGTMENGWIWYKTMATPGLWQLPHAVVPTTGPQTAQTWFKEAGFSSDGLWTKATDKGFDSGFWPKGKSGSDFLNALKWTLDASLRGTRYPIDIGLHSDYYTDQNPTAAGFSAKLAERRQALKDFLDYALSKPDVRVVRKIDVLRYLRNPAQFDQLNKSVYYDLGTSPSAPNLVDTKGIKIETDSRGSKGNLTGKLDWNYELVAASDKSYANPDNKVEAHIPVQGQQGFDMIEITYESQRPLRLRFIQPGLEAQGASFFTEVPSAFKPTTKIIRLDPTSLVQAPKAPAGSYDPAAVQTLAIGPVSLQGAHTGSVKISSLKYYSSGNMLASSQKSRSPLQSFQFQSWNDGTLALHSPYEGSGSWNLMDLQGRTVESWQGEWKQGRQSFALPQQIPGIYLLQLQQGEHQITLRITPTNL
jgi:hypothetical protein